MNSYPKRGLLQRRGCSALGRVAGYNEGEYVKCSIDSGGIAVTIAAMRRYHGDTELQVWACFFFFKLAKNAEGNKDALVAAGALEVLAKVIQNYRCDEKIFKAASLVMKILLN